MGVPLVFPESWVDEWGEDEYGLWMGFTLKGIYQVLRWIPSGEFMAGSAIGIGNSDEYPQHRVKLTHGFWLADVACPQVLWETVMGDKPSHFKGEQRPVEQVSWANVQAFLTALNEMVPGLDADLPTEAQWEYACRAGTESAYSFGEEATPELAQFGQAWGKVGTVEVKSFEPNGLGLYQMHGNVWEWCRDGKREYAEEEALDPVGTGSGDYMVRGGSWRDLADNSRAAFRKCWHSDLRLDSLGFRIACGSSLR